MTSQREEINRSAERLCERGTDFLCGDLRRFERLSEPLPRYLMPPGDGSV